MSKHRKVRKLLYEYLRSELGEEETGIVREHLRSCAACSSEADELGRLLRVFPGTMKRPSDARGEEYWAEFADMVDRSARRTPSPDSAGKNLAELLGEIFVMRKRFAYGAAAGAAVVILLVVGTLKWDSLRPVQPAPVETVTGSTTEKSTNALDPETATVAADSLTDFDRRLGTFFRKSRTLLVGVSNMDVAEGAVYNLEGEQRASRSLLREARYLESGPVDLRSAKLLEDLNAIMIELANADQPGRGPGIELVRRGITRKNLLFKLRMQESQYDQPQVRQASYQQERER